MRHFSRVGVSDKMHSTDIENGLINSWRNSPVILRWLMTGCIFVFLWLPVQALAAGTINIYSHRQQTLIQPFLDAFTKTTGIEARVVYASKGLAQRLPADGAASPADVILTVDIARLAEYANLDLLVPVELAILTANIAAHLSASDNRWFDLSERACIFVAVRDRVPAYAIQRIEDLADAERQQRTCTRPGSQVYNRASMASMIASHRAKAAQSWAEKLVANLARKPQGNDRAQAKAIFQGRCNVVIMNSHYYGNMNFNDDAEQLSWADAIQLVFTNQADRGNHINISGGGVAKHSWNRQQADAFLELLTDELAQQLYGKVNYEYPINPAVTPSAELESWGPFKRDKLPIERLAELAPQAQMIIDRVGW